MTARRNLGCDVLTAARQRVAAALDVSERAYVSFSGGKDSTVMLDLVLTEAKRRGRRVGVLFVDLEGQYARTIDHVAACYDRYADHVDPYWVALPLNLRNAVSVYEPQWMCWDPERERDWVRQPPPHAITDAGRFPWFRARMEFEDFVPEFARWYSDGRPTACFVGIRTQESLNRWRSIASTTKQRVNGWPWTTQLTDSAVFNAYPIYDWQTEDIWTYHARHPAVPRNTIYDLMHRAGLTIHQARICQPYGDDQRRGLWLFHLLEPATWAKIVARVNGANQGALYAQETGNILGLNKVTRPEGHTWESFAELMLSSMPAPTEEHYRNKIAVFLRWWECRGYEGGIPDEADPRWEASKRAPSWRRVCKALLRNDYWCKGLSFSQHKDQDSYARYSAIMSKRRTLWGAHGPAAAWQHECGPDVAGRPTAKQLALLTALTGGFTPDHGYRALGQYLDCSARAAKRRATRKDASDAIEHLRKTDSEFRAEKYSHNPTPDRRVSGLAGESNDRVR